MEKNAYFKPTPLYKTYMILDLIEKNATITQREMSERLNISVSMVNAYLDDYESKGYIHRKYFTKKTVEYQITPKGKEYRKLLNIGYLNVSQKMYNNAKRNIVDFLKGVVDQGFKDILLYGAGEVAEILLQVIKMDKEVPLNAVGVIDDDASKLNKQLLDTDIVSLNEISEINYDAILISSYTHHNRIVKKLLDLNYDINRIIRFFEGSVEEGES